MADFFDREAAESDDEELSDEEDQKKVKKGTTALSNFPQLCAKLYALKILLTVGNRPSVSPIQHGIYNNR